MKRILVTGATGKLGKEVLQLLIQKTGTESVSAIARDVAKLNEFEKMGVKIIAADYDNKESLLKAFQEIDTLYFVSGSDIMKRLKQHENVLEAAKQAGVKQVVYTSFQRKNETESSPIAVVAAVHLQTEKWLKESGMTYTILKHALYSDVLPMFMGPDVIEKGIIYQPSGDGKASFTSRSDMAKAAVAVLTTQGHENKTYEISVGRSYSYSDIAEILTQISGKKVSYIVPSTEEFTAALSSAGVPAEIIGMGTMFGEAIKQGEFDHPNHELEQLIGEKPQDLEDFLKQAYSK